MRRALALVIAILTVSGLTAAGHAAEYDRYDRYERGYRVQPPPPAPPPAPAPRRAAEVPPPRHTTFNAPYFFAHLGFYSPNDDFDGLDTYDTGGAFDFGIGSRLSPFFAIEGTLGVYSAESDFFDGDVSVVPFTLGGRLIVPNPVVEPYIGGGFGIYFSSIDERGLDDDSTDFGGYLSLGLDFWLTQRVALNLEGKYHWVEAEYKGFDVDLSGWTANLGVRVSF